MARFRDIKTLEKFASVHASIHNHFNLDRHLTNRDDFKKNRSAALVPCIWYAARNPGIDRPADMPGPSA